MENYKEAKIDYIKIHSESSYRERVYASWLNLCLRGISVGAFFRENKLNDIIIYGYGKIGKLLCDEIERTNSIRVKAVIDKRAEELSCPYPLYSPYEDIPEHDILIVTVMDTNYVRNTLKGKSETIVPIGELLRGYGFGY